MNQGNTFKNTSTANKPAPINPFARALAETEKNSSNSSIKNNDQGDLNNPFGTTYDAKKIQAEQQKERRKLELRRRLHEQVNPVDSTKLFDARHKQVKEEIEKLKAELKALAVDVVKFNKEIELTLMTEIGDPGQEGKYYISFFQKLRAFIMLLRQRIKSARTWASQFKSKKKKRKVSAGVVIEGSGAEKTGSVYDMMHHERSNAFGG